MAIIKRPGSIGEIGNANVLNYCSEKIPPYRSLLLRRPLFKICFGYSCHGQLGFGG